MSRILSADVGECHRVTASLRHDDIHRHQRHKVMGVEKWIEAGK